MFLYKFFRIILEIKKSEYPGGYSDGAGGGGGVGEYDPGRTGRTGTGTDKRGLEGRIDASQPYVFQTDE